MALSNDDVASARWGRDELIGLLSASGTLAGLCITIVAFMSTIDKARAEATIVDDLLAMCAAVFLSCTYLTFWALRSRQPRIATVLSHLIDAMFLLALSGMTVSGFLLVYTIW